jgi:hypothetical protein
MMGYDVMHALTVVNMAIENTLIFSHVRALHSPQSIDANRPCDRKSQLNMSYKTNTNKQTFSIGKVQRKQNSKAKCQGIVHHEGRNQGKTCRCITIHRWNLQFGQRKEVSNNRVSFTKHVRAFAAIKNGLAIVHGGTMLRQRAYTLTMYFRILYSL